MSRFKVGQEVIFSKGDLKDVKGVVHNPYWQISQSDWPEVVVDYNDGENTRRHLVDIDKVRPAVDPYEYGATWLDWHNVYFPVLDSEWGTIEEAQYEAQDAKKHGNVGGKIMRRLKAGEPEDFDV